MGMDAVLTSIFTVPEVMVTVSVELGTPLGLHVPAVFQLPPVLVFCPAINTWKDKSSKQILIVKNRDKVFIMIPL
jgi:hypothetical protein